MISSRIVEVKEGKDSFISITSVSSEDDVLLFKVKRSNPKVVDFHPKRGVVASGKTFQVKIKLMSNDTLRGRVLIQSVSIGRNLCTGSFEKDWKNGISSGIDMISKIVSIHLGDSLYTSLAGTSCENAVAPILSTDSLLRNSDIRALKPTLTSACRDSSEPKGKLLNLQSSLRENHCDTNTDSNQPDFTNKVRISSPVEAVLVESSSIPKQTPIRSEIGSVSRGIAVSSQVCAPVSTPAPADDRDRPVSSALKTISEDDIIVNSLDDPDTALSPDLPSHQIILATAALGDSRSEDAETWIDGDAARDLLVHTDGSDCEGWSNTESSISLDTSKLLEFRGINMRGNYLAEDGREVFAASETDSIIAVSGMDASENVVVGSIELRVGEAVRSRRKVTAIEIRDSPMKCMASSVCAAFSAGRIKGSLCELAARAMSFLLDSHLTHLTISATNLQVFDSCIGRFSNLQTLDLSRNRIERINGPIDLPCLVHADLSNNLLSSADYLQNLISLTSLDLSSNCFTALSNSVYMLVPLSRTMKSFDMRNNKVCVDGRYVEQVLSVLPGLRIFDGRDLDNIRAQRRSRGTRSRMINSLGIAAENQSTRRTRRMGRSDFSCSVDRSASKTSDLDCNADFDRRLRSLLQSGRDRSKASKEEQYISKGEYVTVSQAKRRCSSLSRDKHKDKERGRDMTLSVDSKLFPSENNCLSFDGGIINPNILAYQDIIGAQKPLTRTSQCNSITSVLSEAITNGGDDEDCSWVEEVQDYYNFLATTPDGTDRRSVSPVAPISPLRDGDRDRDLQAAAMLLAKRDHRYVLTASRIEHVEKIALSMPGDDDQLLSEKRNEQSSADRSLRAERRLKQEAATDSLMQPRDDKQTRTNTAPTRSNIYGSGSGSGRGYDGDAGISMRAGRSGRSSPYLNLTTETMLEMQEGERTGKWNSRYRIPDKHYGFSKPFLHHPEPPSPVRPHSFDAAVVRLRRSFEMKPTRGTFTRCPRTANEQLSIPMDVYSSSRAASAGRRGIGVPFGGLGEAKDIREGVRWGKESAGRCSDSSERGRGRERERGANRENDWARDSPSARHSSVKGGLLRSSSVDSFSGHRKWFSSVSLEMQQSMRDSEKTHASERTQTWRRSRSRSRSPSYRTHLDSETVSGGGVEESKSGSWSTNICKLSTPSAQTESKSRSAWNRALTMKEITRPSVAHVIQLESFDYEEQVQQTAAFEAAAMVALSKSVSVRTSPLPSHSPHPHVTASSTGTSRVSADQTHVDSTAWHTALETADAVEKGKEDGKERGVNVCPVSRSLQGRLASHSPTPSASSSASSSRSSGVSTCPSASHPAPRASSVIGNVSSSSVDSSTFLSDSVTVLNDKQAVQANKLTVQGNTTSIRKDKLGVQDNKLTIQIHNLTAQDNKTSVERGRLTVQDNGPTVHDDKANSYLQWMQSQRGGSEDLTGSPKEQHSRNKDALTITVDTHEDSPTQSSSLWDMDYRGQWSLPTPLPDPCHPWSKALRQEISVVPSPANSSPLKNLFGPARRQNIG